MISDARALGFCAVLAGGVGIYVGCASSPPAAPPPSNLDVYIPPSVPSWPQEERPDDPEVDDEPTSDPDEAGGTHVRVWEGEGVQNDGQRWPTVLRVRNTRAGRCASIVYPPRPDFPVECTGDWICEDRTTDHRLIGVERITEGSERCIDGCRFDANLDTGVVEFDCSDHGVMARAQLTRVR